MAMRTLFRWHSGAAAILLAVLLLVLLTTGNSLPADAEAKAAALPSDLAKIPSNGTLIVSSRVADLWESELLKTVREEIGPEPVKELREHLGLPLEQIERMTLFLLSPIKVQHEEPLLFVHTVKPYDLAKVVATVKNVKAKKYKNEILYVSDRDWSIYPLDDRSLVYGYQRDVQDFIDHPQPPKAEGNLTAALRLASGKHSLVVGVNIKLINDRVGNLLPGEAEPFLPLLQALSGTVRMDFASDWRASAVLTFDSEKDAKAALKPAEAGLVLLRAGLGRVVEAGSKSETQEWKDALHVVKHLQEFLKATLIEQKGPELRASFETKVDAPMVGRTLLGAVKKMREAASLSQGQNNLKQITLAMHNYHDTLQRFPPQATYDKNGKPMLSWRVMILPYIAEQALYMQFHLNEPWDSEHNKKLLARMPKVYAHPQDEKTLKEHTTYYQGFVGKGVFFEGKQGISILDITDGTSNTFMIVEASKAVPWTKPEDIPFDPDKPLPKLGLPGVSYFLAAMCDGSVRTVSQGVSKRTLQSVITRNAGDVPGSDW